LDFKELTMTSFGPFSTETRPNTAIGRREIAEAHTFRPTSPQSREDAKRG
jgi:hypothetical protein